MYNSNMPKQEDLPTSKQLLRSTAIAIAVACALLIFAVMPAEYGIDPTGVGKLLGLTEMGDIKVALEMEAEQEESSPPVQQELPSKEAVKAVEVVAAAPVKSSIPAEQTQPSDERRLVLQPGQAAEIKLEMKKGAVVRYEWIASGGKLNHDTHGDNPNGAFTSYSKGRMVPGDKGELTAFFDGAHGWYWRNRDNNPVTVVLKTSGDYQAIKRVM